MGASSALSNPHAGVVTRKGCVRFTHRVLVGASGAITGQDAKSRVTLTKQGTAGQYKVQLPRGYRAIVDIGCTFIGNTGSLVPDFQTDQITTEAIPGGTIAGTIDGTIILQFRNSAGTATDLPNPCTFIVSIMVEGGV